MITSSISVYWGSFVHDEWSFYLATTEQGLCFLTLPNETFQTMEHWVKKHISRPVLIHDDNKIAFYSSQIIEYLKGDRKVFSCPLDPHGTSFQKKVWLSLIQIPFGELRSYSDVAASINHTTAVRAVGTACGANPIPIIIPCHRVIGKNHTLTGYRGGIPMKARLLTLEGEDI
ncbi:MAG: methylated-DNA--[protein]-cysteine S-methyltransferase [Acidibacillus sp.]|uniref:methylated-DNA--[protein]-cysteine S-methyltransferase n=1 Tax=Sulfoacidibacillus ferrooxidans TaxID=2005001 RepID=A0A9X1V9A0_9BACL|nr:methylated-DNA--[protein]-cysteine S-methyltransferase [Sulfoacidibacillus ferrooxidans]MCI0183951.1 Methylated-DNA--protein-cysteine methyltransferase, inducible [Sulfoacidibacillus ferrooxidans]MCY0894439.1 methylated-DNA--[protein]-cysteine S-methyltransferase [Acidibacillus sp.]